MSSTRKVIIMLWQDLTAYHFVKSLPLFLSIRVLSAIIGGLIEDDWWSHWDKMGKKSAGKPRSTFDVVFWPLIYLVSEYRLYFSQICISFRVAHVISLSLMLIRRTEVQIKVPRSSSGTEVV